MALDLGRTTHQLLSAMDGVANSARSRSRCLDDTLDNHVPFIALHPFDALHEESVTLQTNYATSPRTCSENSQASSLTPIHRKGDCGGASG